MNTKNDFDSGPKFTEDEVFGMCNSLNAMQAPLRHYNLPRFADCMIRAQGMIVRLWMENQELRKKLESRAFLDQ